MNAPARAVTASGTVARTERIVDADLFAVAGRDGYLFEREGVGLAGRGIALRIDLPDGLSSSGAREVMATLAAIRVDDPIGRPGTGPVAFGALPFRNGDPATLTVPSVVVGRSADGLCWRTTIEVDGRRAETAPADAPMERADAFSLTPSMRHDDFCALVARAVDAIDAGTFDKVVLARDVAIEANRPIDAGLVVRRLAALYPSCHTFCVDGFVGASPELLIHRSGAVVRAHPLAGTAPRSGDPEADARAADTLRTSPKERREHRLTVDAVRAALAPLCTELDVPDAPDIVQLRNVSHLGTLVQGRLAEPLDVLELVRRLHPTPAVGGTPAETALAWLDANEGLDRGRYAGPVGWVDGRGDGEFAVGIRSAEIDGASARFFAGVGIVAGSDPEAELAETQFKLQALLAAVVRP